MKLRSLNWFPVRVVLIKLSMFFSSCSGSSLCYQPHQIPWIFPMITIKVSAAFVFLFVLILTSLLRSQSATDPTYLYHQCLNTTTFAPNSTYQANRNTLLASLSSADDYYDVGFFNITAGQDPNKVYGLFLCRGDVDKDICRDCVKFAANDTIGRCPFEKETVIWYDPCMLRYSHRSIFSGLATNPGLILRNTMNISSEQTRFHQLVASLLNDVTGAAASAAPGAKKFATKKVDFTALQTVYSLAQCTLDLTSLDCSSCLTQVLNQLVACCGIFQGARLFNPSCIVHFEIYPFYQDLKLSSPAPAPAAPGSATHAKRKNNLTLLLVAIMAPIFVSVLLFIMGCCFLVRRSRKKHSTAEPEDHGGDEVMTVESLQFDFGAIQSATNNFSDANKLGEGGFGEVYKGILSNGGEVAVKRLSRSSGQGAEEFKNEIVLVAKLQHRNLARLLGFCLEGDEKILVYEFIPNKSLDYFLYDPEKQWQLDWPIRYKLISGIARGVLYLHEDSRLRIIHRDLKASNILLDRDMNPKISDFGMARIFGVDQTQANTKRIVGTYGYMSPEYAMHGQFSVKSDVYSFGVLILEIISGKKNSSFYQKDCSGDLLSYTWKLWRDGTPLELLDSTLGDSYSRNEVIRCIQIGLLCVQENPADRPTMATIVLMLNSYSVTLPLPGQPAYCLQSRTGSDNPTTSKSLPSPPWSVNDASITELHPR